jgi:hypothetical protein
MAQPGQFSVGQLYLGFLRNGLKVWAQPGGIGTPVVPQPPSNFSWFGKNDSGVGGNIYEWPVAYPAQYYFGCGHPLNCPEIYSYYDPYEEVIQALICCPVCSYIQEIMPLSTYEDYVEVPIVVA